MAADELYASERLRFVVERFATPDGEVVRPAVHHPGAVAVLAVPAPGHLLLVRQYRYPIRRWTLELPAGTRVVGEEPLATARRELAEEAGYAAARWSEVLRFLPTAGLTDEEMIIYRADDLRPCAGTPDHGELVSPQIVPFAELAARRADGSICDAKTLLAMTLLGYGVDGAPC